MATFVLIHGGYHGGWCWERLVDELASRGHTSITPDLPIEDSGAGFDEYTSVVLDAMEGLDDTAGPVVVVGHSLGCYVAPLVATRRTCNHLVFLCAVPTGLGEPIGAQSSAILTGDLMGVTYFTDDEGRTLQTPQSFQHLFYEDVPERAAEFAVTRLRPQGPRPLVDPWPLRQWPEVLRTVVLAEADNVVRLEAARPAAKALTGDDPIVVSGGHSVFLTDPGRLAEILVELSHK